MRNFEIRVYLLPKFKKNCIVPSVHQNIVHTYLFCNCCDLMAYDPQVKPVLAVRDLKFKRLQITLIKRDIVRRLLKIINLLYRVKLNFYFQVVEMSLNPRSLWASSTTF